MRLVLLVCVLALAAVVSSEVIPPDVASIDACTSILLGTKATDDGSVLNSHTSDCAQCDFRSSLVPAKDHPKGSVRKVYPFRLSYPRYVGYDRGDAYFPENTDTTIYPWKETEALGTIPQVEHTYSYVDAVYGIMNEKQLAMGESTCSGKFFAYPPSAGGKALFDVAELSRVAMERCATSRCAVELMGELAEKYGYYQCDWTADNATLVLQAGEALTVSDPKEAWMFHIQPDDTGASAIWVAQRVPDNHIAVVANDFTIQEIDLDNKKEFLGSKNLYDIAKRYGWWKPEDGKLNFQRVYSTRRARPEYVSRRMWRVYDWVAPSLKLRSDLDTYDYPFSVPVERPISSKELIRILRDHYEGTEYDLTKGLAAGPYGTPNRFDLGTGAGTTMAQATAGGFERAISLFRTTHSYVQVSRDWMPDVVGGVFYFGHYAPSDSVFTPFYGSATQWPESYKVGSLYKFDRDAAWWAYCLVGNWADKFYRFIHPDIEAKQQELEDKIFASQRAVEAKAVAMLKKDKHDEEEVADMLSSFANGVADEVTDTWWKFFEVLVTKFHDGYIMADLKAETLNPVKLFYPPEWLAAVGFWPDNKIPPADVAAPTQHNVLLPNGSIAEAAGFSSFFRYFLTLSVGVFAGLAIARFRSKRGGYEELP